MQAELTKVWDQAKAQYMSHLKPRERSCIENVTSRETLLNRLRTLEIAYSRRFSARLLSKIHPFVAQLHSFTRIINIFTQGEEIASLIWGPLALVLEVSLLLSARD